MIINLTGCLQNYVNHYNQYTIFIFFCSEIYLYTRTILINVITY